MTIDLAFSHYLTFALIVVGILQLVVTGYLSWKVYKVSKNNSDRVKRDIERADLVIEGLYDVHPLQSKGLVISSQEPEGDKELKYVRIKNSGEGDAVWKELKDLMITTTENKEVKPEIGYCPESGALLKPSEAKVVEIKIDQDIEARSIAAVVELEDESQPAVSLP